MTIKFKIKQVKPCVFMISVKDRYDRGMLFCRVQEYYESPNFKFRNKIFSIWDYIEWYSREYNGFTYPFDWSGYNFPLEVAENCYELNKVENVYDEVFKEIINNIKSIDKAVLSIDSDSSISATLELLTKDINHKNTEVFFFNSGDRSINNENLQEKYICDKNNINRVFIRLPKIFSSSELKRNLSSDNIK